MALDIDKIQPPSPAKLLTCLLLTIGLVILVTEMFEAYFRASEIIEGFVHILVLSGLLAPLFFFFWFRPLKRQVARIQASEEEIRKLSHRLMKARELERRKLARDLHDVFGQKITTLQVQIDKLQHTLAKRGPAAAALCSPLLREVNDLSDDLRSVLADLRPATLDDLGLVPALESLCRKAAVERPQLGVEFRSAGIKERLDRDLEIVLFRTCQEALTNILKHANARHVEVSLFRSHPKIILAVDDDGCGLPDIEAPPGKENPLESFGLVGMRERVASVGGDLRLLSRPAGLRIRIEVPEVPTGGMRDGAD